MLKTIPYDKYDDEILLKFEPNVPIETLRSAYNPKVVDEGVIVSGLNFNHMVSEGVEFLDTAKFSLKDGKLTGTYDFLELDIKKYSEIMEENDSFLDAYGVCDNAQQVVDLYDLEETKGNFTVCLTPIRRDHEPAEGGWRWSKWGRYIGTQNSNAEYIHDESEIELVYVYHVYPWSDKQQESDTQEEKKETQC